MIALALSAALAASPYAERTPAVAATASMEAPPEAVFPLLEDLEVFQQVLPCASDWSFGTVRQGLGASVQLTYDIGSMHRRLNAAISQVKAPRVVDYDHAGNKGFVTRWEVEPEGAGSAVRVTTYINPPPWPFRKLFFERIEPQWVACYEAALAGLAERVPEPAPEVPEDALESPAPGDVAEPEGPPEVSDSAD